MPDKCNCYTNRPIVVVSSSCTTKCFHTVQWWSYFPWTAHGVRLSNDYTAHCCTLPVLCAFTVFVWWYELRFQSCSSSRAMMVVFCSKYLLEIWSLNKFLCVYWYLFSGFFLLKSEIHFKNVFVDFFKNELSMSMVHVHMFLFHWMYKTAKSSEKKKHEFLTKLFILHFVCNK